jgi:GcrA cell cycle regulator
MSWTIENIATLKSLWTKGETASAIAKALGNVTRNAVIGKAHRLHLTAHPPRPSSSVSKTKRSKHSRSRAPKHARAHGSARPLVPARGIANLTDPPPTKITTAMLQAEHCHWPEGDPRRSDFHYCGRRILQGQRYCPHHYERAYQKQRHSKRIAPYE